MANISDAPADAAPIADWKQKELVAAYVGATWEDYEPTYQRLMAGHSGLGFSWILFLVPWVWLTYRKLYMAGIAVWLLGALTRPVGFWLALVTLLAHIAVAVY